MEGSMVDSEALQEPVRAWLRAGAEFRFDDHPIFYRVHTRSSAPAGEGTLLIHGFPTSSWDWSRVWDALSQSERLLAPDLLGFGFSAKPQAYPYSILRHADLIEALLERMQWTRVHVLAHDYGVTVAQELIARDLERTGAGPYNLASVCFLNGGLFPETHRARPIQRLLASPLGPFLVRFMREERFHQEFSALFGPRSRPDAQELHTFWQLIEWADGRAVMPRLLSYMAERRYYRTRWVGALVHGRVPQRVINGLVDPVSGAHMVARYRDIVSKADVVELPRIGHYPQWEAADAVLQAYRDFRARIAAPGT
jgi:pimeloyl-ACP methyl ester carboxylesterase